MYFKGTMDSIMVVLFLGKFIKVSIGSDYTCATLYNLQMCPIWIVVSKSSNLSSIASVLVSAC